MTLLKKLEKWHYKGKKNNLGVKYHLTVERLIFFIRLFDRLEVALEIFGCAPKFFKEK